MIEMASGRVPWEEVNMRKNQFEMMSHIGRSGKSPEIPEELSESGRDFLQHCLWY